MTSAAWAELWPPFGVRITCGDVELRVITDDDLLELAGVARDGIHDRAAMPFYVPWSDGEPSEVARRIATYQWRLRAAMTPSSWSLEFAVRRAGVLVGSQGIGTHRYPVTRTGETGSWLGLGHQGRGTGTLMRQALCAFMFDELGAAEITSGAFTDNPASLAVSRKVGYVEAGTERRERRPGELALNQRLSLTPEAFTRPAEPVETVGAEQLRAFLAIDVAPHGDDR